MLASTVLIAALFFTQDPTATTPYDPLRVSAEPLPSCVRVAVDDTRRERSIPLRIYLPNSSEPRPVVLFSHGLGGSCENNPYLGEHWAQRGYVVVAMQHVGSDESVWRGVAMRERMAAMRTAASADNLRLRAGDVTAVLDALATWNQDQEHNLHGRLDLDHIGISGHSFGAMTTQVATGQKLPLFGSKLADVRIDAGLAMSPTAPRAGNAAAAFAPITVPWMSMTGTADTSPINDTDVAARLAVYPALPATIDRYELVLFEAAHSAFSQRPARREPQNKNHHRVILALSTAFWDAHLTGDAAARQWLRGDAPRAVMEEQDRWQWANAEAR